MKQKLQLNLANKHKPMKIERQIANGNKVTQEVLDKLNNKTYTSGKTIKLGDVVLFALLKKEVSTPVNEIFDVVEREHYISQGQSFVKEEVISLISLKEEEIGSLYCVVDGPEHHPFTYLSIKESE
jgi:hypothetical protein